MDKVSIPFIPDIGYAGFRDASSLAQFLFPFEARKGRKNEKAHCERCILQAIDLIENPDGLLHIFVFFVKKVDVTLDGVYGYCSWKNTILLFLDTTWEKNVLRQTVVHETCHSREKQRPLTLKDALLFEGRAEVMVERLLGKKSKYAEALNKKESLALLKTLKRKLSSKDMQLYRNVFFGSNHYKKWSGYSLGYWMVKENWKI